MRTPVVLALVAALASSGCRSGTARTGSRKRRVSLVAVGDVLLARGVGRMIQRKGPRYPFTATRHILAKADIAFFNLECPLSRRGSPRRRRFLFRADPSLASVLKESGFDVVSLANNHTLDYGRTALMDTIRAVEEAGMVPVGAGRNRTDAHRLRLVTKNGLKVGFLAYTDVLNAGVAPLADRPSVAYLDPDEFPARVRAGKKRCDVLVVSVHWGVEYMKRPTGRQKRLARLMVDNGADLILGHHPHVLQPVETYKDRPIVYSMGGFVWDAHVFGADRSAIYRFDLGPSSARLVETIPIRIRGARPTP